ncbi:MAG TPA: class I SAM-dependent rRNA methyltransferase [Terriglobales bacterium]|nr:class I SAM-dependent rRNA methyltransferase [Terriglobales bacterium]
MTRLILKKGEEARMLAGHRHVYMNEVARIEGELVPGGEAEVVTAAGRFVGQGLLSPASKIVLRIYSYKPVALDREFFAARLKEAWDYRRSLGLMDACRLVFGEADGLPGLVVDKYGDWLSVQILTAGLEARREMLCELLCELLAPKSIYERSDVAVRRREGLPERKELLYGDVPDEVVITENGFLIAVDVKEGQKTGHYLDQRENHAAIAPYVKGRDLLDACCFTGGFALHGAGYGAKSVLAADISLPTLERAKANLARNALTAEFVQADVFELLPDLAAKGRRFGMVVLDPPAFCKNKSALEKAYRGYREINYRAMNLLEDGGYLVTCSCSHYMTPPLFEAMLREAAILAGVRARLVESRMQSRDHPVDLADDESLYLKCKILRIERN